MNKIRSLDETYTNNKKNLDGVYSTSTRQQDTIINLER
jgi:hypothetical protein